MFSTSSYLENLQSIKTHSLSKIYKSFNLDQSLMYIAYNCYNIKIIAGQL